MPKTCMVLADNYPIVVMDKDWKELSETVSIARAAKNLFLNPNSIWKYVFKANRVREKRPLKSKITGKEYRFKLKQV